MSVSGVRFIKSRRGRRVAVVLDLKLHRSVWEDIDDTLIADTRRDEPRVSWGDVKMRMRSRRARRA